MRTIIQRVSSASVQIEGAVKSSIGLGLLVLVGVEDSDDQVDIDWLCGKISRIRIFDDANGQMNLSVQEVRGEILVISQFTLHALVKKSNRPSFIKAARPETAIPLYESFLITLKEISCVNVCSGIFGADMKVALVNNGPVTIFIDSKDKE